ncbi:MAG: hypothetical protein MJ147_06515 [Clostridia bacterium]|nr:hypothetical protein [Clostridia bacterium]
MRELINDPFYEKIKSYNRCIIDYCLIESDTPHQGYRSHLDTILFALDKVNERYTDDEPFLWSADIEKAEAKCIDSAAFLHIPDDYKSKSAVFGGKLPYWYAFLKTPHRNGYGKDDFVKINDVLFPNGMETLEVYEWNTDWSNYFDDGHEWWGAACWSIYDRILNRYVVIMASTTD